jgi:uncharacterized protein
VVGFLSQGCVDPDLSVVIESPPGSRSVTVAIYLFGFSTAVVLLGVLSAMGKPFFTLLLSIAATRMVLSGVCDAGGDQMFFKVAGGFALGLAALAMYGGTALALEDAKQRELLPLFRRGEAAKSFEGFEAQLERLEAEPGVRPQL